MRQYAKSKGIDPDEVYPDLNRMPYELEREWRLFQELSAARGANGFGPNPIAFRDIKALVELMGIEIAWWQVKLIRQLDDSWMKVWHARSSTTKLGNQQRVGKEGDQGA